jgi:hypothetical protein
MVSRQGMLFLVLGAVSGFGMAVAALMFIAPVDGPPPAIPFQDKIFHAVAFACLTGPGVLVLPKRYLWFWITHMVVLGAGIEWAQARSDLGRAGDVMDFIADCVGVALAYGVGRMIRRRFEENGAQTRP